VTTFITGATGFIGSAVARRLLAAGHHVRALVRDGSDTRNLDGLDLERRHGDLRDRDSLARAIDGCEAVFHLAADYRLWTPDRGALYASNVDGTRNVVEASAAAGVRRMVYTSSVATLGLRADGTAADEDTPLLPGQLIGDYKRSKAAAERVALETAARAGLELVVVNPSAPVGPRDVRPTPTGRIIVHAALGKMPVYVDTGLNLVHVDDVAIGHLLAFERGEHGERYVLGGENLLLREILERVAELVGGRPPVARIPRAVALPVAWVAEAWARVTRAEVEPMATVDGVRMAKRLMFFTSAKAERVLGYRARPVAEGLRDAITWFRDHGYC
jgi:dihydroflavonol-4-reductase